MCMDRVHFYGLLCLSFMFHGMINDALGQTCSCIDSGNCDFTHQCVPEGACVKENVALGKVANISSLSINSGPACLMVNGNTTMAFSTKNCVKSGDRDNYPSWTVDLSQDYTITNLSIYPEPTYTGGLRGVEITVDGRLCYTFPDGPDYGTRQDVQCTQPQRGRIVKLYSSKNYYIFFCELQIWVCTGDDYDNDCGFHCGNCLGGVCDKIYGTCPNGCEAGWQNNYCKQACDNGTYGQNCSGLCGNCTKGEPCDKVNGTCLTCEPGLKPSLCQQVCDNGTYGQNCSSLCGNCTNGEACDKISGSCLSCKPGMEPPLCQQACNDGYYGQNCSLLCGNCLIKGQCDKINGSCLNGCAAGWMNTTCEEECKPGYYGPNCNASCGNCVNGAFCNKTTGICPDGCNNGWKPPNCKQTCDNGTYGQNCSTTCGSCTNDKPCDKVNGTCDLCKPGLIPPLCQEACIDGHYGQNCSLLCGNCFGEVCDNTNGSCPNGCEAGWMNMTCEEECNDGYYGPNCKNTCGDCVNGSICNKTTGVCPYGCNNGWTTPYCNQTCTNGTYGQNCSSLCGNCTNGEPCDKVDGQCLSCDPGLKQPLCNQGCDSGTYGQNCSYSCGNCTNKELCDKVNGTCSLCNPGWNLPFCQEACANGTYGQNCSNLCGNCTNGEACDKVDGKCGSCVPGMELPFCTLVSITKSGLQVGSIAGGVVGGVACAVGVIIVIIFIRRRQKQRKNTNSGNIKQETDGHIYNNETMFNRQPQPAIDGDRSNVYETISNSGNNSPQNEVPSAQNANTKREKKPFCAVSPNTGSSQQVYANVERLPLSRPEIPPKPLASKELMELSSTTDDIADDSDVTYSNDNVYSTYQSHNSLADLDNMQRNLLESLKSDQHARKQFQNLLKGMKLPHTAGSLSENLRKNRFKALCPYDNTRVKLQRIENDLGTDYINASYIRGYDREKAYIAAQGPRDHTVDDTWLMIWQENVTQIVMLTNLKESGKEKCTQYWPPVGTTLAYGHVTVTNQNEQMRSDFVIRTFSIKFKGKPFQRQVEQYHYISWSDHGIPSVSSLVNFWRYVKERGLSTVPLLVHCSAGVGRTGTYIALDIAMETAIQELGVDVFKIVTKLREDRAIMVQTESQYRFLYEAILEAYTSRNTRLTMEQFDVMVTGVINVLESNEVIDKEFKMLQQMGEYLPKPRYEMAESQENRKKNRHPDALPDDNYLAYLSNHLKGRNFYINAVFLSSFKHIRGILLTQLPLPDTLVDIWRLIEDKEVNTIVSIGSKDDHKTVKNFCQYWPRTAGETLTTGPYTVTLTSSVVLNDHLTSYHLSFKAEVQTRDIQLLHYTNWVGEVPDETSDLIQLVEKLNASRSDDDKSPILVQCIDGMAKSGLFCVLWDVISRASCDQEIDIYLTARHVQTVRRRAVTSEVQFRYCYKVAQDYFCQVGVYQNM